MAKSHERMTRAELLEELRHRKSDDDEALHRSVFQLRVFRE